VRLQSFLRESVAIGREVVRVPPFTAFFDPSDPLTFLNYAIPDDGADPDPASIEALRAAFRERERLPRLEWIEEAAPVAAAALAVAGMTEELRAPLMTCTPGGLREPRAPAGVSAGPVADAECATP
jgi:hypothetical protein